MSTEDKPTAKPADDFDALMAAIGRLQHVIRSMGPQAKVAEIRLAPTRDGRAQVETAIKTSPSYLQTAMFPTDARRWPPDMVCEIMGVKLIAESKD